MKKLIVPLFLLMTASRANAALAVAQAGTNGTAAGTAVTITMTTSAGSLLVIQVREDANNTSTLTITDSAGQSGWTQANGYVSTGASNRGAMFYRENSASVASITATWSGSLSTAVYAVVFEITGAAASSSIDGAVGRTGNSGTSLTSGSLTTASANDILIYGVSTGADETSFTAGTGYAIPANGQSARAGMQYKIVSSVQTGVTTSMSWTATSTTSLGMFAAFKAAGAAPPCANPIALMGAGCR